jgi:hypothetical protein
LASFRISFQRSLFPVVFLQPLIPTFFRSFQRGLAPFTKEELFIVCQNLTVSFDNISLIFYIINYDIYLFIY